MTNYKAGASSGYRPDIDGVRALAILAVVVFHAFPGVMRGGFVGVDVFFVISGYLITGIILRGIQDGDFSFRRFYAHRVKRLFPALVVVVGSVLGVGCLLLLPDELKMLSKHVVASFFYFQNFVLASEAGYFDVASDLKPLTHMWSLSVEEQFYFVFPLLMVIAWRLGLNLLLVIIAGGVISFGLNMLAVRSDPGTAYYLPHVRFWELLAGSVVSYVDLYHRRLVFGLLDKLLLFVLRICSSLSESRRHALISNMLSLAGVSLIAVSLFVIGKGFAFPGKWAVAPVLGASIIIFAGSEAWVNRTLLANPLMVFVGLISYPLYLWHWPLLSYVRIVTNGAPSELLLFGVLCLSILLAWLTYRYVERPIRSSDRERLKIWLLLLFSVVLSAVSSVLYFRENNSGYLAGFSKIVKAAGEWDYPGRLEPHEYQGIAYYLQKSSSVTKTLFVGDSNVEQYYPRVEHLIKTSPDSTNGAIFKTGGGCLPVQDVGRAPGYEHCQNLIRDVAALVKAKPEIDTIVIGAQWYGYLRSGWSLSEPLKQGDASYRDVLDKLSGFIRDMVRGGKQVYLITNIPTGKPFDPKFMARRDLRDFPNIFKMRRGGMDRADLGSEFDLIRSDLDKVATEAGAIVIDPVDYLCGERCESLDEQGEPIYKDTTHLRPSFVRHSVNYIDVTVSK